MQWKESFALTAYLNPQFRSNINRDATIGHAPIVVLSRCTSVRTMFQLNVNLDAKIEAIKAKNYRVSMY